jgi:hypothetical protein
MSDSAGRVTVSGRDPRRRLIRPPRLAIESASSGGLDAGARWALAGGAALFLVCMPERVWTQTVAAAALVALALVGSSLEPIAFVALAAGVLVAVVAVRLRLTVSVAEVAEEI